MWDIPTPHILLFIISVNFEVYQMTDPFTGSLLNSTVSMNDCDGKGGVITLETIVYFNCICKVSQSSNHY